MWDLKLLLYAVHRGWHWFPRARNFLPVQQPDWHDGVHLVGVGWSHQVDLSAVDRSLNSMKASAGLVSTLLLIPRHLGLIGSLKTQFWKLLPSMLSTGTLMVQFQSWSSYTIGVGYPSIFWMTYSSSLSILSAVLLASSSSFWEIDDLSITHIHCLVSTYP